LTLYKQTSNSLKQLKRTARKVLMKTQHSDLKAFAIRDAKAEVYNTPFFQKSHGEAERSFMELVKDKNSLVAKYPEDFDLYYLGTYNSISGLIDALETPQHMTKGVSVKLRLEQPSAN